MADVTVMGAGIFGLSLAFTLAQRGARVQVLEACGVGAGSSGGVVGALAPHVPENWNPKKAFQLDSLLMAAGFWADVARIGGRDPGYARLGRVQPILDAPALARAHARGLEAETLWQGQAHWRVIPRADAPGRAFVGGGDWVVHDTLTARLSPRMALDALVAALAELGVQVVRGSTAPTDRYVVWATGAQGLADLGAALGADMGRAVKGQAASFRADWPDAPQLFIDGLHIVPHADGSVAIGSTSENRFANAVSTDAGLDALIAQARAMVPALADAPVVTRWAGLRPRSPSRAPMLGPWPGREGHFVMNGGFKIGFGMAPKLAVVMADMLEGRDTIPPGFRLVENLKSA